MIAEKESLTEALQSFSEDFQDALRTAICARIGVHRRSEEEDAALLTAMENALAKKTVTIDRFFFDWRGGKARGESSLYGDDFAEFRSAIEAYQPAADTSHPYWSEPSPCSMHIDEVEAIWARIDEADDWSQLEGKVAAIRRMGEAMKGPLDASAGHSQEAAS